MTGAKARPGRPTAHNRLRRALGEPPLSSSAAPRRRIISHALPRLPERSSEAYEPQAQGQNFASRSISGSPHPAVLPTGGQQPVAHGHVLDKKNHTTSSCDPHVPNHARESSCTDEVTHLLRDSLRIKEAANDMLTRVRSSSSSYHSRSSESQPKSQSPPVTGRRNVLRLSDFSKYSRENDRLSNLNSSTETAEGSGEAVYDAAQDAAEAVRVWERGCKPPRRISWNRYELPDSPEVHPSDSASLRGRPATFIDTANDGREGHLLKLRADKPSFDSIGAIKDQFDGIEDHRELDSPNPATTPCPALGADPNDKSHKRKASVFSLRSLASSLPKRPRLGFRKKATGLFQRIVSRGEKEKQNFRNWRANQRRLKPAKALKGEHQGSYGAFKIAEKKHGDKEWWAEGVEKYRAPAWMEFESPASPVKKRSKTRR